MAFIVEKDESDAGRRTVGFRLFGSNGTSPATTFSTGTILGSLNGAAQLSLGSASVVSANAGQYAFALSQSNVSVLGSWDLFTDALVVFPQHVAKVQVVNNNPMSTQSNVDISARTALGVTRLDSSVTLRAVVHSGATIKGIENYANISDVTLHAGTHSGATVQGVSRVNSGVTLNADSHSGATIQGLSNYANISNVTLHAGVHSGATVQINSIAAGTYSAVSFGVRNGGIQTVAFGAGAIDAAALAADAAAEIADALLGRTISGGASGNRTVTSALRAIRNRVFMDSGSTGTVYEEDDTTSAWTFSVSTVAAQAIDQIDPGGL